MKNNEIGERIKRLREDLGFQSQTKFARYCGLTAVAVSNYERGERIPSPESAKKIAIKCNVSLDYILCNEDQSLDDFESFKTIINAYETLSIEDRILIISMMKRLSKK